MNIPGLALFIPNPQTCTFVLQGLLPLITRITTQDHLPISDVYSESIRSVDGLSVRCLLRTFILSHTPFHPCRNLLRSRNLVDFILNKDPTRRPRIQDVREINILLIIS